jgi:hypothetical protein
LQRQPDLYKAMRLDLATGGLVAESDKGLLIYCAFSSRVTDDPTHVIGRGPSGSGKSTLLKKVGQFIPVESKIETMTMTPASVFRTADDYFRHKVFLSGERRYKDDDEARDATAIIRQLLSEHRVSKSMCIDLGDGWQTVNILREGPVAYGETTTKKSIFEEDLNRMFEVWSDDSAEQDRRVIESIFAGYDRDADHGDLKAAMRRQHEFQDWLSKQPVPPVHIPYGNALAQLFRVGNVRVRRAAKQLAAILETLVLLNQHRRELRPDGALVATVFDYVMARQLLMGPFQVSLGLGQNHDKIRKLRVAEPTKFDTNEAKKSFGYSKQGTVNVLNELQKRMVIAVVNWSSRKRPSAVAGASPTLKA